ncbi:MAG: hypothetical protein LBH43_21440 [Treponema sp.]|jgi:hypothetical protein|nr:hypothetical protein [Treponema sp.]
MKTLYLILAAALLSCTQPTEPTALPEQTPVKEQPTAPETPVTAPMPDPEPEIPEPELEPVVIEKPEPDPEPITPPYGSTVIGEKAYYVSGGAAMSLNLRTGEAATISTAAREYERINEYDYTDNADTGRYAPWTNNAVFIEANGALWIIERGYSKVKAQVITAGGAREFGYVKQIDFLPLAENAPGKKIEMSYEAGGRFYRIKLYQVTDPNAWIPFQPPPVPDYILRCQEITLRPEADRCVVMGAEKDVHIAEKFTGAFTFEYLADGRILAAGKLFRLTAEGVAVEL